MTKPTELDLRRIDFGYADAGSEWRQSKRLVRQGYYDLADNESRVLKSHEFLVLGYKGAGKSSVGTRLRILALDSPSYYYVPEPLSVADLPLDNFKGIVPDSFDALQRYQHSWSLLLLSRIVTSAATDAGAATRAGEAMREAERLLVAEGVEPGSPKSLRRLKTARVESRITLPRFYERTRTLEPSSAENAIRIWLSYLESVCEQFRSQRRHYYFLDGLDDLRVVGGGRALLLGGLLQAVERLNGIFQDGMAPIKIVLACRTDVYGRMEAPRAGKLRRDAAVEMDWYQNPRDAKLSHLVGMVNKRAQLVFPRTGDLFGSAFQDKLFGRPIWEALIEQTRHTPRDILQLLKTVQKHVVAPGRIPQDALLAGIRDYSQTYFRDELDDAMRFYFEEPDRVRSLELLGVLRRRSFLSADLKEIAAGDSRFKKLDVDELITVLFENGFLGNITRGGPSGSGDDYFRFKYRSPRAGLRWDEEFGLHPGLWKALNVA